MSSEILINVRPNQTRVALVNNGELSDLKIERRSSPTLVGSVYKGKVSRVLPGMQAAFIDIGLPRAAFLYAGDIYKPPRIKEIVEESDDTQDNNSPLESTPVAAIQDLLQEGQNILVQIAKEPLGTKGARVTTHISLAGRYTVYLPTIEGQVGLSRKIADEKERNRLEKIVQNLCGKKEGAIVRTAGEGALKEALSNDFDYLKRLWLDIQKQYEKRKNPSLIYSELGVELRALRDLLDENVSSILVDDAKIYRKVGGFISQFMPQYKKLVQFYKKPQPLFDIYDLDLEISRSLARKVWLKSGGYVVFDEAEALVVIDVNTGKYVGKNDFEDTILRTNLEAVKEIAYQLKIRNCGGIIIIDLIDMEKEGHREKVILALQEELKKDRAYTEIISVSDIWLVEMTRKRNRPSLVSKLCQPCTYCDGKGYIKQKVTVANEIFRELEREAKQGGPQTNFIVSCHGEVADWISAEEALSIEMLEEKLGRSIALKAQANYHIERFEISSL